MSSKKLLSLALMVLAWASAWAQSPPPGNLANDSQGLAVEADQEFKNVIVGRVLLGGSYDSRALATTTPTGVNYSGDTRFFIEPSIAFQQTHRTYSWTISGNPGASVSQHRSNDFLYTTNASGEFTWTPSERIYFHARQDYMLSTNPFEQVGRGTLVPEPGGIFDPGYSGVMPDTKREALLSSAEVMVRLARHTAVGFTGGYQDFNYNDLADPATHIQRTFLSSRSVNASAYVSQQFSKTQTVGVQYALFDIYTGKDGRTMSHAIFLFDRWRVTPRSMLTLYAGPEYSHSRDILPILLPPFILYMPISDHSWHPAAGATYTWTGTRNAFEVDFSRRVSQGVPLMQAVTATSGTIGIRSLFTKRWTGDVRLMANNMDSLPIYGTGSYFRTYWAGVGLTRDLTRNVSLRADYARVRQQGFAIGYVPGDHNLVQFSIEFHFVKPFGR
jgi:hypothetical protein